MRSVAIGPFAWPSTLAVLLAGVVAAFLVDGWWRRRGHASGEPALWSALALAVLAARAAFVVAWWPDYRADPLGVFDLRDGGWSWPGGLVGLGLGAAVWAWRRPAVRPALAGSLLAGALVAGFGALVASRLDAAVHAPLPAVVLRDLDDRPVPLRDFVGKPLVVNLWATWCAPCRRELPLLARAQQTRRDVRFAFVDPGEAADTVRTFLAAAAPRLEYVLLDAAGALPQAFGSQVFPTTLFFDAQGILRSIHVGALSPATLAAELRHVTPGAAKAPASSGVSR